MDVAEALQAKGYEIDRKRILMKDHIKEAGDYTVPVRLHREVVLEIPVAVVSEGGAAAIAAEIPAETAEEAAS